MGLDNIKTTTLKNLCYKTNGEDTYTTLIWNHNVDISEDVYSKSKIDTRNLKIESYKVFDEKVVIVKFVDGISEKVVCDDSDTYSFEMAISLCVAKHICRLVTGNDSYNDFVNKALKDIKHIEEEKEKSRKKEEEHKRIVANRQAHAARRKEKKRQQKINDMAEAYVRAMNRINDDLK